MENIEIFEQSYIDTDDGPELYAKDFDYGKGPDGKGWFYWFCLPGCLPDSDLFGPFESKHDAEEDAKKLFDLDCE